MKNIEKYEKEISKLVYEDNILPCAIATVEGINSCMWTDECLDLLHWKTGNCFRTEEEAKTKGKEIMEQIKKEYEEA